MSIKVSQYVDTKAANNEISQLEKAKKLGVLNSDGSDALKALQSLVQGDPSSADDGSAGASDSGCCSDSSSTKGAGKKPAAGAFVVGEGKTPNLARSPAGTAGTTGSNPNLVEGRVPNPDVVPTVTASADTEPVDTAPAVAAPAVTTPPKPDIPADWHAGSAVVI
jgi:hypothetical protein